MQQQLKSSNPDFLSYSEFIRVLLPSKKKKLREKMLKKQKMNSNGNIKNPILESKIKFAVAQVFDQAIKAFADI